MWQHKWRQEMSVRWIRRVVLPYAGALLLSLCASAAAQSPDCTQCHGDIAGRKVVHAALQMGCTTCHADLDASAVPHKSKGKFPKGLPAEGAGVCAACHDAKMFEAKVAHAPVAAGMCTGCHNPHSSDYAALMSKPPAEQCLECHGDVKKRPHVIVGFGAGGHPLGDGKKVVADPLRSGKTFYCASCHAPHGASMPKLLRFEGKGMVMCQKCHKM
jgi:predicted CXXCH cytochrome family protein